ncbi:hypothetical protein [Rhizobium phage RHEph15]|nr:hypothetical protein [Rhizobium phage RHEph15]
MSNTTGSEQSSAAGQHKDNTMTVSSNPAQVEFPRDTWGFTTALRKYGLLVAGAIRGDEKKLELFIQTLGILAQHAQARIESDKAARAARLGRDCDLWAASIRLGMPFRNRTRDP